MEHRDRISWWWGTRHLSSGSTTTFSVPSSGRSPVLILLAPGICTLLLTIAVWDEKTEPISPKSIYQRFYMTLSACNQSTFPEIILREATICYSGGTHSLLSLPKGNLNRKLFFQYQTGLHLAWLLLAYLCCHLGTEPFMLFQLLTQLMGMLYITRQS